MGRPIYYDVLDTVRTANIDGTDKERHSQRLAAGQAMLAILLGDDLTLSQTQGFDSSLVLGAAASIADGAEFMTLIRKGIIQVRLYSAPTILDAFTNALRKKDQNGKYVFRFSAWPEMRKGEVDQEAVAESVIGPISSTLPGIVLARLDTLHELDDAIRSAGSIPKASQPDFSLSQLLNVVSHKGVQLKLQCASVLCQLAALNTDDRSKHYDYLDEMQVDAIQREQARQVVDMCYNRAISSSLGPQLIYLTAAHSEAVEAMQSTLVHGLRRIEVLEAASFSGLTETGWGEVARFARDVKNLHFSERVLEAKAARFLASIAVKQGGYAILPKATGSLFGGLVWAAAGTLSALATDASTGILVTGLLGFFAGAISGVEPIEKFTREKIEGVLQQRYSGLIQNREVSTRDQV